MGYNFFGGYTSFGHMGGDTNFFGDIRVLDMGGDTIFLGDVRLPSLINRKFGLKFLFSG